MDLDFELVRTSHKDSEISTDLHTTPLTMLLLPTTHHHLLIMPQLQYMSPMFQPTSPSSPPPTNPLPISPTLQLTSRLQFTTNLNQSTSLSPSTTSQW